MTDGPGRPEESGRQGRPGQVEGMADVEGETSYRVLGFDELDGSAAEYFRRRRRRRLLTFVTLPGLLLGTATVAAAYGTGLLGKEEVTCQPQSGPAPERDAFEVEVLNSNDTEGLATTVATSLEERGFDVEGIGNADDSVYVREAAIIYYGETGRDNALLLQKQVPGAQLWQIAKEGPDVQLVLGYGYKKLIDEELPPPPAPSEITLNVYNTTFREGLADEVRATLEEREFTVESVGNDPRGSYLADDVAVIRYGPEGAKAAARLKEQVDGVRLEETERDGATLDLVLGNDFKGLRAETEIPVVKPFERPAETIEKPCQAD